MFGKINGSTFNNSYYKQQELSKNQFYKMIILIFLKKLRIPTVLNFEIQKKKINFLEHYY